MNGKLIVIEGLDGSGKATQSALLEKALAEKGEKVMKVSFPNYESDSSALVKMYLAGEMGKDPYAVNAYAASSFYAADRYVSYKTTWGEFYNNGGIIIADRYTTSNAIHQCCKIPEDQWEQYLDWLFHYEYELLGIPTPDKVIYLKLDIDASQKLMSERYGGDDSRKDIHESNTAYLKMAQAAAEYCIPKLGWECISCYQDGAMRSIEDIHEDIMKII